MTDDYRFGSGMEQPGAPAEKKSRLQTCLIGCLVVFVIGVVVAVLIGFWIARNARSWVAAGGSELIRQGIEASQLPPQEKQEIMVEVERVAKALREGTMSMEQLGALTEKLVNSPLMESFVAMMVEAHYFAKSGLSAEEKTAGSQTLQRFVRGSIDKKINEQGIDAAMAHVADRDPSGQWQLRQQISDADLRAFLAEAKKQADEAGIPEQPASIDPSDEVKRIVDESLNAPK